MAKYKAFLVGVSFLSLLILQIAGKSPCLSAATPQKDSIPSQSALAVSPAIIEEVLTPGKPTEFSIDLHNVTNFPLPVKAFARSLTVQSLDLEKTERDRLDASQWFEIDEPDFILQPNQVRTVQGKIQPPLDVSPGGHYATLFFQPLVPEEALSPSTAYLNARVGVLSFLIVKGDIIEKAGYGDTLKNPGLLRQGPVNFDFSVHNTGNVHLMPTGKITVRSWRGNQVAKMDLPLGVILPQATKKYAMQWGAHRAFGKYHADLAINYGSEQSKLQQITVTFWIIPWVEIAGSTVVLGGIIFFVYKTHRRWRTAWEALTGR